MRESFLAFGLIMFFYCPAAFGAYPVLKVYGIGEEKSRRGSFYEKNVDSPATAYERQTAVQSEKKDCGLSILSFCLAVGPAFVEWVPISLFVLLLAATMSIMAIVFGRKAIRKRQRFLGLARVGKFLGWMLLIGWGIMLFFLIPALLAW